MKLLICTGEVSGDRYGAAIAHHLNHQLPSLQLYALGSEKMKAEGVTLIGDLTPFSTIGLIEPIRFLPKYIQTYLTTKKWMAQERPEMVIAIDNQGFNLLILKAAKKLGLRTAYFIAPQEWQWGTEAGGKKVIQVTDTILSIFPKEAEFYKALGGNVTYVGHPLADLTTPTLTKEAFCAQWHLNTEQPILSIFPGSRHQELTLTAPTLIESAANLVKALPHLQVAVSIASTHFEPEIKAMATRYGLTDVSWVRNDAINLIAHTTLSLAASGTVTLEHALLQTPCIVAYRFGKLSYWLATTFFAERVAKIPFMSLPNLMANRLIMPEFFQNNLTVDALTKSALSYLTHPQDLKNFRNTLSTFKSMGNPGVFKRVATTIVEILSSHHPIMSVAPRKETM